MTEKAITFLETLEAQFSQIALLGVDKDIDHG
jgi:hypothetical protein